LKSAFHHLFDRFNLFPLKIKDGFGIELIFASSRWIFWFSRWLVLLEISPNNPGDSCAGVGKVVF
jgi:hypothetical protein